MRVRGLILALALLSGPAPVAAQELPMPQVLIIDSDRLYLDSAYGKSIRDALEQSAEALQAENDAIQAQLIEEERSLTERRPGMSIEDFRAEAEAFDVKVQAIRRTRDAKIAQLEQAQAAGRDQFYEDVRQIVGRLMLDRGAVLVFDRRSVFLALGSADITAEAIARIDAQLMGQQPGGDPTDAAPVTEPLIEPDGAAAEEQP